MVICCDVGSLLMLPQLDTLGPISSAAGDMQAGNFAARVRPEISQEASGFARSQEATRELLSRASSLPAELGFEFDLENWPHSDGMNAQCIPFQGA